MWSLLEFGLLPLLISVTSFVAVFCSPTDAQISRHPHRIRSFKARTEPVVSVKNGSYAGLYDSEYNQEFFLGIPFAQPPIGDLRFRIPHSLNESFAGIKSATAYPPECAGYGGDEVGYVQDEDCLYLNVIRPNGTGAGSNLPVAVWIHGGGLYMGGTADKRYNLSFIVDNSVKIGKPIIGLSIQYRLSAWGFLGGAEALAGGATNLGFRDQRLALHWIQENIAAFGGDPSQVTIWGESAGGQSVGYHLTAYNGRDDGLFRAAIAESGGPGSTFFIASIPGFIESTAPQKNYDALVANTSCAPKLGTSSSLDCLRSLPYNELNATLAASTGMFSPVYDGDYIADYPSSQLRDGRFVKVPLLIGSNTDEGTSFGSGYGRGGTDAVDSDAQFLSAIEKGVSDSATAQILTYLYPDIPAIGIPGRQTYSGPQTLFGRQSGRVAAFFGDAVVHSIRRAANIAWATHNVTSYSYRFDVLVNGVAANIGATHFQEVAFVFDNVHGLGYTVNPFANTSSTYLALAKQMSKSWVAFIHDLDPNGHGIENANEWPPYVLDGGLGKNFVWSVNESSFAELDTFRAEGIAFIIENAKKAYGR